MRWLWESARRGSILHLLILMLCTLPAVMSFSGQVWTMVNMLILFAIFAGPWLWWSRAAARDQESTVGIRKRNFESRK
jgi:hypothetical protein